ncbi:1-deoxy-11-beta-hydroxypentalenate dehydrogenase [Streptomyces sp. WMMC1477]|uniref:1-deoxy-11-beta-hydroxypentalenate dehydrogenase n=1 Tax=Streptomyces sp. WMMC1477 TaxID=3015155 RepID=UPI0022B65F98|nr:SDR family NAD(P)-dependent oxidoreductase [Streptomyces sp. WMMC1477]MCZ7434503.1 SDR family NAD(P)-dependent oxidoreductase [Streptomyces sp. WMMC1477]
MVTGAASGIGLALSARFARAGVGVVMADVESDALHRRAAELTAQGAQVIPVAADLTDPEAVEHLADTAFDQLGDIGVVCNNAGVLGPVGQPLWEVPLERMRQVFEVNHWAHVLVARAFTPRLLERGRPAHLIHTASMSAFVVGGGSAAYAASKHADLAIARSLRADLEGTEVRVSVLCPGRVDTPMVKGLTAPRGAGGDTSVSAEDVAEVVWGAIGTDRFYLFSNSDAPPRLRDQFDDVWRHLSLTPASLPRRIRGQR